MNYADILGRMHKQGTRPEFLPSFGRRQGKGLTSRRQALLRDLLPQLQLTVPESGRLDATVMIPGARELWLEIGFGGGEHLLQLARNHPDKGFIGAEPFINGVAKLLDPLEREKLGNIRIVPDDIRPVMKALPDACLQRIYLLFPDPWRKSRHYKRRILSHAFLDEAARLLPRGGILQLATDHRDYSVWMLEHILARRDFSWQAESCRDWQEPPAEWVSTRYEQKAKEQGRQPVYLRLTRQ